MTIGRTLLFLLVVVVGGILLQLFLSRRDAFWPGLILPGITFLFSLVALLGVAVFDGMGIAEVLSLLAAVFLLYNIPTLVLLGIYFACRERFRRKAQMEKMNIQDLD